MGIAALSTPRQDIDILRPVEDAYTRGGRSDDDNFGREESLNVKQGNSSNFFRRSYLNFRVNNPRNVDAVVLRLYATRTANADITLYATESGWSEDTITWNNAPPDGQILGRVELGPDDQWYEWDVSSYLLGRNDENVSFVLYDAGRDNRLVSFSSSEGNNPPELRVLYSTGTARVSNLALNLDSNSVQPPPQAATEDILSSQVSSVTDSVSGGGALSPQYLFLLLLSAIATRRKVKNREGIRKSESTTTV